MLKQELISLNDAAGWRNALAGLPHAFAHTWEYVSAWAQTLRSSETVWLYVAEQAGWRRVCPLAERDWRGQRDIVTPYGFSGFTGNGMPHDGRAGWLPRGAISRRGAGGCAVTSACIRCWMRRVMKWTGPWLG
jgi:hypothetical protein